MKQPMQKVVADPTGLGGPRFHPNAIVRYLHQTHPASLDDLRHMPFSQEDWTQYMQLIGYSVCGFGELDFVDPEAAEAADEAAAELI